MDAIDAAIESLSAAPLAGLGSGGTGQQSSSGPSANAIDELERKIDALIQSSSDLSLIDQFRSALEQWKVDVSREIVETVTSAKKEIGAEHDRAMREIERLKALKMADNILEVLDSPCVARDRAGKFWCALCTEFKSALADGRHLSSKWIASNGGFDINDSRAMNLYNNHIGNHEMHKICLEAQALAEQNRWCSLSQEQLTRADETTKRLLMLVAHSNKEKRSSRAYERDVKLLHLLGVDVGERQHSRITGAEMSLVLAEVGMRGLEEFLTTVKPATGRKPHVGMSFDKQTDLGGLQSQVHMMRVNFLGTPVTVFASLTMLEAPVNEEEEGTHEADGYHCFQKICDCLTESGVALFEETGKDAHGRITFGDAILVAKDTPRPHSEQFRTACGDGEAVYNGTGPKKSVRARLVGDHGLGDVTFTMTHDPAHAQELLLGDAHKGSGDYVAEVIHSTIKDIYGYFSASPHKLRHMEKLVEEWGADDIYRKLHYLFETRFIESEFIAVSNFLATLPAIYAALQKELDDDVKGKLDDKLSATTRTKIGGWLRKIKQFKFVAHLIVMVDVHTVNKIFSKRVQSDAALVIDVPTYREKLKDDLTKLRTTLGAEARRRLESLKKRTLVMADADKKDKERVLTLTDEDGDEVVVGTVNLAAATGDVQKRLLKFQKGIVDGILEGFDDRIQDSPVFGLLRKVFDIRRMPLDDWNELETWSDDEVKTLVEQYFPELDVYQVQTQALTMRRYAMEHHRSHRDDEDNLLVSGHGSILEALFKRPDMCGVDFLTDILHIADYMISFMFQSCNSERAASHINLTKTKSRTLLGDGTLNALVFNTMNLPELHEIDFDAVLKAWIDDGRKYATFKTREARANMAVFDDDNVSKVLKRQLEVKSDTFLWKKEA